MIKLNNKEVQVGTFPNGETYIDMDTSIIDNVENTIELKFKSDVDLMHLRFVKGLLDEIAPNSETCLIMKYIPYSRMDRQQEKRLFTLKYFANFINEMKFSKVKVWEPHSSKSEELINNIEVVNKTGQLTLMIMSEISELDGMSTDELYKDLKDKGVYLVYPDKGAKERYNNQIKYDNIITCSKKRDFNTGRITSIDIDNTEEAKKCKIAVIMDDLCSKGGTFICVASQLKELGVEKVYLAVTHCENTIYDGALLINGYIDKVYTTDSILDYNRSKDNKIIEILE